MTKIAKILYYVCITNLRGKRDTQSTFSTKHFYSFYFHTTSCFPSQFLPISVLPLTNLQKHFLPGTQEPPHSRDSPRIQRGQQHLSKKKKKIQDHLLTPRNTLNIITLGGKCEQTKQYAFIPLDPSYLNRKTPRNAIKLKHKSKVPSSHHTSSSLCIPPPCLGVNRIPSILSQSFSQLFLLAQFGSSLIATDLQDCPHETIHSHHTSIRHREANRN